MSESLAGVLLGGVAVNGALVAHRQFFAERSYDRAVDQLLEEAAELAVALLHERRGRFRSLEIGRLRAPEIVGEAADLLLCLELVLREHGVTGDGVASLVNDRALMLEDRLTRLGGLREGGGVA